MKRSDLHLKATFKQCICYFACRWLCRLRVHERIFLRIQFKKDATLIKTPGYSGLAHSENVSNKPMVKLLFYLIYSFSR